MKADTLYRRLEGLLEIVEVVKFSPNSGRLASALIYAIVRLWDIETGTAHITFGDHSGLVRAVAFSLDGRLLASGSRD